MGFADTLQQPSYGAPLPFYEQLHTTVPPVPDRAFQRKASREASHRRAEADPLNLARIDDAQPFLHAGKAGPGGSRPPGSDAPFNLLPPMRKDNVSQRGDR